MNFGPSVKNKASKETKFKERYKNKITAFSRKMKLSFKDRIMLLLNKKSQNMPHSIIKR